MTTVAYCKIGDMPAEWQHYLPFLEAEVVQRVERMRKVEDQLRTVCAHLLTKMVLVTTFKKELSDVCFSKDSNDKYQIEQNLQFNITHSGNYVACAISKFPVGIDIEQHVKRDFSLFQSLWSDEEKQLYPLHEQEAFYSLWTAKESYGKYKGFGLQSCLTEVTIHQDGTIHLPDRIEKALAVSFVIAPKYSATVCIEDSLEAVTRYEWEQIGAFFNSV
ncbi:4'-phosphopantetheinyl transferase family protein [Solibacillus merdavium]|uniref:4'-phosphopantetheinyl transferase superfamily protein n=1 Tax=Solibacillus merdavium TaxID=2762218 RepID=A0ABR8XMM3_9BACL|nr:4'-phosphopantetheinyl transferase superfamily protein [Solibacillus merdavium]MBD8033179.1 4'-phosphopantetheinyl transferase superfamily protein [Solibacillus merdavium]